MEHARKMVPIPEDSINRLSNVDKVKSVQTAGTPDSRLDAEMYEILNSRSYASDRDKWSAYMQTLQRYLQLNQQGEADETTVKKRKLGNDNAVDDNDGNDVNALLIGKIKSQLNDTLIVDSVPKKFRPTARLLLNSLHRNATGKITWDTSGVVSIDGTRIPNSNIIDLVNDAMRSRKREQPIGHNQFAKLLQAVQIPREFIGNNALLEEAASSSDAGSFTARKRLNFDNRVHTPIERESSEYEDADGEDEDSL